MMKIKKEKHHKWGDEKVVEKWMRKQKCPISKPRRFSRNSHTIKRYSKP